MLLGKFLIINIVISCVESCLLTPSVFLKKITVLGAKKATIGVKN